MIYPQVNKVIDILNDANPSTFNMDDADLCIAGQCRHLSIADGVFLCGDVFSLVTDIEDFDIVNMVVYPYQTGAVEEPIPETRNATLYQAVRMLEILRDTGKVDWHTAMIEA